MRQRLIALALLLPILLFVFSGCSGKNRMDIKSADLMANINSRSGTPSDPDPQCLSGMARFSSDLLLSSLQNKGNTLVSPISVFLALAMTANGAEGQTKEDMLKVLAGQNISLQQINETAYDLMALINKTEPETKVTIANSIWFRADFEPSVSFLQCNADYFGAGAYRLDFSDPKALDVINGWVKESTHGLIDQIISQIKPTTVMYLINTLYFKADWMTPFEKPRTGQQAFRTPNGSVMVDMMHRTEPMKYFTAEKGRGIILPYINQQFAYFAMLPDEGIEPRAWLSSYLNVAFFDQIGQAAQAPDQVVALSLPRYEASYEDTLNDELNIMGMGIAFDGGRADFSNLSASKTKGLYISEVRHKTKIRVDEKGTEAAAATSVAIDESAVQSDIDLVFDRPFIYGIMDLKTNLPLFIGLLEDPTKG